MQKGRSTKKWMKSRVQQRRVNHDEKESKKREKKWFWKRMSESVYNKKRVMHVEREKT